jgi:hypothetical protein
MREKKVGKMERRTKTMLEISGDLNIATDFVFYYRVHPPPPPDIAA